MLDFRSTTVVGRALFAGLVITCLGSYFGNVFIAAGHVFLLVALGVQMVASWKARRNGLAVQPVERRPRPSAWFLVALLLAIIASVLVNLQDIKEPLSVLKKTRYHVIWAGLLFTPGLRTLFFRRIADWAPWLLLAWLASLTLATLSGMVGVLTGYNPLLLAPEAYPTRVAGVSTMVMTYAYSVQFSVLLLASLFVLGKDARDWIYQKRGWLEPVVFGSLVLAVLGLYFSYTRGALAGALAGGVCLLMTQWRSLAIQARKMAIGVAVLVVLAGGVLAWKQGSRYVSWEALKADSVRVCQWKAAWLTFLDHPWFGLGYRQFEQKCVALKKSYGMGPDHTVERHGKKVYVYFSGHAHNEYLEALASTGLLGALAFLGFCGCWFREVLRGTLARAVFLPVIVAYLLSGFVQNMFTDSEVLNFLLFLYFLSQVLLDWEESRSRSEDAGKMGAREPARTPA